MWLTAQQQREFLSIVSQLSPENLARDGEASRAEISSRRRALQKRWAELERQVGRKVTHDEIWNEAISR